MSITFPPNYGHEAGCPKLTAAGNPQCTCGMRKAFIEWGGVGVSETLYGAFCAGWMLSRAPRQSQSFTIGGVTPS